MTDSKHVFESVKYECCILYYTNTPWCWLNCGFASSVINRNRHHTQLPRHWKNNRTDRTRGNSTKRFRAGNGNHRATPPQSPGFRLIDAIGKAPVMREAHGDTRAFSIFFSCSLMCVCVQYTSANKICSIHVCLHAYVARTRAPARRIALVASSGTILIITRCTPCERLKWAYDTQHTHKHIIKKMNIKIFRLINEEGGRLMRYTKISELRDRCAIFLRTQVARWWFVLHNCVCR